MVVCGTHCLGLAIFLWVVAIVLDLCCKEFRFGLHADSVVLVDFLHVLGSIEGRFVSAPDAFKQMLGLFCHYYGVVDQSLNVLCLGVFGIVVHIFQ